MLTRTIAATIIAACALIGPAQAAEIVPCDSFARYQDPATNVNGEPITLERGVAFPWAVRREASGPLHPDARDPIWQHALCDTKRHIVRWRFPQ
jgi:hypothetical protein